MLEHLPPRVKVDSAVLVCDNAPCHSKFEECVNDNLGLIVCRLGPYSPRLFSACAHLGGRGHGSGSTYL